MGVPLGKTHDSELNSTEEEEEEGKEEEEAEGAEVKVNPANIASAAVDSSNRNCSVARWLRWGKLVTAAADIGGRVVCVLFGWDE
jgi:hypothetical protein